MIKIALPRPRALEKLGCTCKHTHHINELSVYAEAHACSVTRAYVQQEAKHMHVNQPVFENVMHANVGHVTSKSTEKRCLHQLCARGCMMPLLFTVNAMIHKD